MATKHWHRRFREHALLWNLQWFWVWLEKFREKKELYGNNFTLNSWTKKLPLQGVRKTRKAQGNWFLSCKLLIQNFVQNWFVSGNSHWGVPWNDLFLSFKRITYNFRIPLFKCFEQLNSLKTFFCWNEKSSYLWTNTSFWKVPGKSWKCFLWIILWFFDCLQNKLTLITGFEVILYLQEEQCVKNFTRKCLLAHLAKYHQISLKPDFVAF